MPPERMTLSVSNGTTPAGLARRQRRPTSPWSSRRTASTRCRPRSCRRCRGPSRSDRRAAASWCRRRSSAGDIWQLHDVADGSDRGRRAPAFGVDLSCGRIDVWSGMQPIGPAARRRAVPRRLRRRSLGRACAEITTKSRHSPTPGRIGRRTAADRCARDRGNFGAGRSSADPRAVRRQRRIAAICPIRAHQRTADLRAIRSRRAHRRHRGTFGSSRTPSPACYSRIHSA